MAISFAGHHFLPAVNQHAVWLCLRFTLRFRDVEEWLAERGFDAEQVDAEIASDREREKRLGLSFATEVPPNAMQFPGDPGATSDGNIAGNTR